MSGDFWGSQEGCQGPSRPSGRNRGLPLRRRRGQGSPPGSSIHGIFQARVLEWGAIAFSRRGIEDLPQKTLSLTVFSLLRIILQGPPGKSVGPLENLTAVLPLLASIRALDFREHASTSTMLNAQQLPSSLGADGFMKSAMPRCPGGFPMRTSKRSYGL